MPGNADKNTMGFLVTIVSSLNNGKEDLIYFSYKHFTYFFIQKSQQDNTSPEKNISINTCNTEE